ncbi:MAG: 50S ribosomal protein L29 [Bacilli bacterium]|nr:50S ribosomal protein L29 [Bacilli bacterium]
MKANEIRKLTREEIESKIKDSKSELLDLRMKQATGVLENTAKIDLVRKDVARMMTVLNEMKKSELEGGNK